MQFKEEKNLKKKKIKDQSLVVEEWHAVKSRIGKNRFLESMTSEAY